MASTSAPARRVIQQVRPILSLDREEARRRVLNLYKAWYRSAPFIGKFGVNQNNDQYSYSLEA